MDTKFCNQCKEEKPFTCFHKKKRPNNENGLAHACKICLNKYHKEHHLNNKEKRKMLSWVYFKYQLDNDYKVIKQTGFNEEQQEIYRNELSYTDSSITSNEFKMCSCPEKTINKTGIKI
jgi:hypothetical protein